MCIATEAHPTAMATPQVLTVAQTSRSSLKSTVSTTEPNKKKTVSFGGCQWRKAKKRHSFDDRQQQRMWYTKTELKALRKHLKRVLKDRTKLDIQKDCWRGIETYANNNRKIRYQDHVLPVLDFIWDNQQAGVAVEERAVRSFAKRLNRETALQAWERGARDAAEAMEIYREHAAASSKKKSAAPIKKPVDAPTKLDKCCMKNKVVSSTQIVVARAEEKRPEDRLLKGYLMRWLLLQTIACVACSRFAHIL